MLRLNKLYYLAAFLIISLFTQCAQAASEEFFGVGMEIAKDQYNKKLIITKIIDNTPAQTANIKAGSEIVAIDNKKVKKLSVCEAVSKIRGPENTVVKLKIKKNFFMTQTYELTRSKINVYREQDELFNSHWAQIAQCCHQNPKLMPKEISSKFSRKYRKTVIALDEYWFNRQQTFRIGYNACMNYSNKNNQEYCLVHLMDREAAKTNTDKTLYKFLRN